MRNTQRGFALPDLVAVAGAAHVLVAVAVPVVARTVSVAGTKLDAKQIKDIHAAFLQYAAINDGNPVVVHDDDYDFDAYDPRNDVYWDVTFLVEIYGVPRSQEANAWYAHMGICGDRRDLKWRDTGDGNDPVLGTRGVRDGQTPGTDDYDRSPTLLLHGAPDTWVD